jgi:ketosteroid isomerase-like protein
MFRTTAVIALAALPVFLSAQSPPPENQKVTDEQQLIAIEQQWGDAEVNHDEAVLNRILDDNFVMVAQNGQVVGKAAFIGEARKFTFTSMKFVRDRIQANGDTAIVVDSFTIHFASGADSAPLRCTVTYVKRQGQWRALAEQIGNLTAPK